MITAIQEYFVKNSKASFVPARTSTTLKTAEVALHSPPNPYMTIFSDTPIPNSVTSLQRPPRIVVNPTLDKIDKAKGRIAEWLHVEQSTNKSPQNPPSRVGALALDPLNHVQSMRELTKTFPTFCDFMQLSLYDKDIGYYSTGKVKFGKGPENHFSTFPNECSPWFGKLAVEQAFSMWQSMLTCGDLLPDEPFTILELGAGNGRLAYDILSNAKEHARLDPATWGAFYSALQYQIVEHAPALREQQSALLAEYGDKAIVRQGDARSIGDLLPPASIKGLVFTNELPDAFPVHTAIVGPNGSLNVGVVFPYLTSAALEKLPALGINVEKLREKDSAYSEKFGIRTKVNPHDVVISKRDLKKIIHALDQNNLPSTEFIIFKDYKDFYMPDEGFPDVKAYRIRHKDSIAWLKPDERLTVNLGMRPFIKNIAKVLGKGFMTTIDYGHADKVWADHSRNRYFRCFPSKDPFANIAALDITTDIPWTQFNREGADDFDFQFFGYQNALGSPPLASQNEMVMKNWLNKEFKMHIQKIKGTKASYHPPGPQLPLLDRVQRASLRSLRLDGYGELTDVSDDKQNEQRVSKRQKS